MADVVTENCVALCPSCRQPHAFTRVRYKGGLNDQGFWSVTCLNCRKLFLIDVINPLESRAKFPIEQRFDETDARPNQPVAKDQITHDLPDGDYAPFFDFGGSALYRCPTTSNDLEWPAQVALVQAFEEVTKAYGTAENACANGRCGDVAVVHIDVPCGCGVAAHAASFYTRFPIDFKRRKLEEYLLADISGTCIEDRIEGIYSKSDVMAFLSKLLVRWHLTCDRIIVASPFVGHKFDDEKRKQDRWDWLLAQLDPQRATLITRPATFKAFKGLSQGDVTYDLLKRYGLENKIVSANTKKHDFHAKFFIGLSSDRAEVLSGSANLVHGPSVENAIFRRMDARQCKERYLDVMNVSLPAVARRTSRYVRIHASAQGEWVAGPAAGWPLAT